MLNSLSGDTLAARLSRILTHYGSNLLGLMIISFIFAPAVTLADIETPQKRKEIKALHVNPHAPRIDGKLTDPAWESAEFVSDFIQKLPDEGAAPTERTDVAIIYDADAIYIGARMFSANARDLRTHLDRRDRQGLRRAT